MWTLNVFAASWILGLPRSRRTEIINPEHLLADHRRAWASVSARFHLLYAKENFYAFLCNILSLLKNGSVTL